MTLINDEVRQGRKFYLAALGHTNTSGWPGRGLQHGPMRTHGANSGGMVVVVGVVVVGGGDQWRLPTQVSL